MNQPQDIIAEISGTSQSFRSGFWMKRIPVLHNVTLRIPRRSVFGFLGANGAGKTTLIHLLVGIRKPFEGTVRINGHDAATPEARALIGYLPERPYFHEHLTGSQLLRYFGALSGMTPEQITARIPEVLTSVGLLQAAGMELRRYSKGMLQRIGIAQALLHNPEFLVLDEPMSGLDPVGRKEIRELILRLSHEGRTIFFSSHVIPDVETICDEVALIQQGRIITCGPIGNFLAQGDLTTEVAFSGISLAQAEKIATFQSIREMPDGIRATVGSQDAVQSTLQGLLNSGARVLWVTPLRPSLESLFEKGTQ